MRLTNGQKKALHAVARQAGLNNVAYRLVLRNLAGVDSAASPRWRREDFIMIMGLFEKGAGGQLKGNAPGYWRDELRLARPGDALRVRIRREAAAMGWTEGDLDRFVASNRMSSGQFASIDDAPAEWLVKVLEAVKAMKTREQGAGNREKPRHAHAD